MEDKGFVGKDFCEEFRELATKSSPKQWQFNEQGLLRRVLLRRNTICSQVQSLWV